MKHRTFTCILACILMSGWTAKAQTELIPMVEIPAGSFYMGSLGEEENYDEAPLHKVYISKPFRMGMTEVTNAQYEQFCPEHKALRGKNGFSKEDDEAVVCVSYEGPLPFANG